MKSGEGPGATTVSSLGEKRLIAELRELVADVDETWIGIGDDAAVVPIPLGHQVVISTDRIPADLLSWRIGFMDMRTYGRYLAEVNLSDLAAMGAQPRALLLNISLPGDFLVSDFKDFVGGFAARGLDVGAPLVGGDTCEGSSPFFSATALGSIEVGKALRRSGAEPGDHVFVSGTVGGFGAALAYFFRLDRATELPSAIEGQLREALLRPTAQLEIGMRLSATGQCSACIDITDGFGESLRELERAGNCEFDIDEELVPLHPGVRPVAELVGVEPLTIACGVGLDLQLLGTGKGAAAPEGTTVIGRARAGTGIGSRLRDAAGRSRPLPARGWQHFAGDALNFVAGR